MKKKKKSIPVSFMENTRDVVRDFVFGMQDGLISNLGLVLGVWQGGGGKFGILLAGLASMFAGAFSMSAGSYLSSKSQREVYENEIKETREYFDKHPERCYPEMKKSLRKQGLNEKQIDSMFKTSKYQHSEFVCNYMVQKKVGISDEKLETPLKNAFAMFFSFLLGSLFPIAPFIFMETSVTTALVAVTLTVIALFFMGWAKSLYTKLNWFKSGLEIVIVGVGAGFIGYLVGYLINLI